MAAWTYLGLTFDSFNQNVCFSVPIPHCFYYHSSTAQLENGDSETSSTSFIIQDYFSFLLLVLTPFTFSSSSSCVCVCVCGCMCVSVCVLIVV